MLVGSKGQLAVTIQANVQADGVHPVMHDLGANFREQVVLLSPRQHVGLRSMRLEASPEPPFKSVTICS